MGAIGNDRLRFKIDKTTSHPDRPWRAIEQCRSSHSKWAPNGQTFHGSKALAEKYAKDQVREDTARAIKRAAESIRDPEYCPSCGQYIGDDPYHNDDPPKDW